MLNFCPKHIRRSDVTFSNDSMQLYYNTKGQLIQIEEFTIDKTWETFQYQKDTLRKIVTQDEILEGSLERIFQYEKGGKLVKRIRINESGL